MPVWTLEACDNRQPTQCQLQPFDDPFSSVTGRDTDTLTAAVTKHMSGRTLTIDSPVMMMVTQYRNCINHDEVSIKHFDWRPGLFFKPTRCFTLSGGDNR